MSRPRKIKKCCPSYSDSVRHVFHDYFWRAFNSIERFEIEPNDHHLHSLKLVGFVKDKPEWLFEADVVAIFEPNQRTSGEYFCKTCGLRHWDDFGKKVRKIYDKCSHFEIELCYERDEEVIITAYELDNIWTLHAFMDDIKEFDENGEARRKLIGAKKS